MMANSGKLHIAVIGVETGARKPLAVSSAFFDCSHPFNVTKRSLDTVVKYWCGCGCGCACTCWGFNRGWFSGCMSGAILARYSW